MTKTQKIWLWVGLGMFVIPEILWSPILNLYYEFWQTGYSTNTRSLRENFITSGNLPIIYKYIVVLQLLGLISCLYLLWRKQKSLLDWSLMVLLGFITIFCAFAVFVLYSFNLEIL